MMGKNLPDTYRVAMLSIAGKPHGYWRRDPESNRARRICNPASAYCEAPSTEGRSIRMGRFEGPICPQLSNKLPDPMYCTDAHRYNHSLVNVLDPLRQFASRALAHAFQPVHAGGGSSTGNAAARAFLRFSVRARIGTANGPCRGRTQDSDGALSPGASAFRRDRSKPAFDAFHEWAAIGSLDKTNTTLRCRVGLRQDQETGPILYQCRVRGSLSTSEKCRFPTPIGDKR